jgi:hypothetical protein
VPEGRVLQLPALVRPAIGGGGWLPRNLLVRRSAVALGLVLLLSIAKYVVASGEVGQPDPLAALHGRSVTVGLDIGGSPTDSELLALATSHEVHGVVNVGAPNVAEQAIVSGRLGLTYLSVPVAAGRAPTWSELRTLAVFLRGQSAAGYSVYMHGGVGGAQAVVAAGMLLLLRGEGWGAVWHHMTRAERSSLSHHQLRAIRQLTSALASRSHSMPANPYSAARFYPW